MKSKSMILSITIILNIVLSVKSMLESETKDIKKVGTRKKKKRNSGKIEIYSACYSLLSNS